MDIVSLPHSSPECQGTSCVYFLQGTQQKTRWYMYRIQNNVPQARLCVLWGFKARAVVHAILQISISKTLKKFRLSIKSNFHQLFLPYETQKFKKKKCLNFDLKNENQYRLLQPCKLRASTSVLMNLLTTRIEILNYIECSSVLLTI